MSDKLNKTVLALGYFDSVHIGHQKVIKSAKEYAVKNGAELVIVTFSGNLKAYLHGDEIKAVYTKEERESIYGSLGADKVFFAPTEKEFLSKDKLEFLDLINERYGVIAYFCGEDYRFGKRGSGSIEDVVEYAKLKGQQVFVSKLVETSEEKISTTLIKRLLSGGNIKQANELLGRKYSISGEVFKDRAVGRTIGFPTVNIMLDSEKQRLKDGVYMGKVELDVKEYKALINYGARPTFNLKEKLVEAHIVDYNGELYGQRLTLQFCDFMRDIIKFDDVGALKKQLKEDLQKIKETNYD